jgi:hypothetical protein
MNLSLSLSCCTTCINSGKLIRYGEFWTRFHVTCRFAERLQLIYRVVLKSFMFPGVIRLPGLFFSRIEPVSCHWFTQARTAVRGRMCYLPWFPDSLKKITRDIQYRITSYKALDSEGDLPKRLTIHCTRNSRTHIPQLYLSCSNDATRLVSVVNVKHRLILDHPV